MFTVNRYEDRGLIGGGLAVNLAPVGWLRAEAGLWR